MSDTWHPPIGPRVLILFAHKRTRVTIQFTDNQPIKMCHVTLPLVNRRLAHVIVRFPRQMLTSSVPRVTHPVVTRVTSRLVKLCAKNPKLHDTWHHLEPPCVLYGHATYVVRPSTCPIRTVQTGTVSIKFFLVWLGEQIAISSPYGLRL
jgi:hypothetical protein